MSGPPKPPRGILRSDYKSPCQPTCVPVSSNENFQIQKHKGVLPPIMQTDSRTRTPLRDRNDINVNSNFSTPVGEPKYSSTEKWNRIRDTFRKAIISRNVLEFSGFDATTVMLDCLMQNKNDFKNSNIGRDNAIKVLEQFMITRVIQSTDKGQTFMDSRRSMYRLLAEDEHSLVPMSRMGTPLKNSTFSISENSTRRKNSFKSFLRRSFNKVTRDISVSRSASVDECSSVYTNPVDEPLTQIDFETYRAALFRLLTIIDVPHLDDVANLKNQAPDHSDIPILSAILSKISFWSHERKHDLYADEETDDALASNRIASRELLTFFNMCRIICPQIALKCEFSDCQVQCSAWASQCIEEVSAQLRHLTRDGCAPLIPLEFTSIVGAIIIQVLMNDHRWKDEKKCLQYLVLMIPPSLRKQVQNVIQMIHSVRGTRIFCNMGQPQMREKADPMFDENFEVLVQNIANYIAPSSIGYRGQKMLIKGLVALFETHTFGSLPVEIEHDLEQSKHNSHSDSPVALNIRFCEKRPSIEEDITTRSLVEMIHNVMDSTHLKVNEKAGHMKKFRAAHPYIYDKYFSGWLESH